jgi:prepilin-type N-terminal cleavage/methylation domain-containing protein
MTFNSPHLRTVGSAAFTLVEVMLALAVSAILLAAIGGVFFSALRLRDRTSAMLDASVPLHQAFAIMRRDLQGALPPGGSALPIAGDFKSDPQGGGGMSQGSRLQIYTTTGVITDNQPWGDVQEVVYELRDAADRTHGGKDLVRTITRNLLASGAPDENDQWLLGNIRSLEFACYDGIDWRDSWDTSLANTNLPSAVRVRVQLASDNAGASGKEQPFELVVPISSQSRTNQPQATTTGGAQ